MQGQRNVTVRRVSGWYVVTRGRRRVEIVRDGPGYIVVFYVLEPDGRTPCYGILFTTRAWAFHRAREWLEKA